MARTSVRPHRATPSSKTARSASRPKLLAASAEADVVVLDAARDNTLYEDATGGRSNGAGQYMFTGNTDDPRIRRALIAFDVAGQIPAGSVINSVELRLHCSHDHDHTCDRGWGQRGGQGDCSRGGAGAAGLQQHQSLIKL